jgi:Domain of unknown function (DUF4440)
MHLTRAIRTALLLATAGLPLASLHAQGTSVRGAPLSATARQRFVGRYTIAAPAAGQAPTPLRVYEDHGTLLGQLRQNDPSPLLYLGGNAFRVASAPDVTLRFTVAGGRATRVDVVAANGTMHGTRLVERPAATEPRDASNSGALFDELARMDSLIFDAAYVVCEPTKTNAFLTDDVEFYHDRSGFHQGAQVRADFDRLAANCPRTQSIARELVPGSLHVYPIADYGAVQTGLHRFVQRGAATVTDARFVHLWRRQADSTWKLARVLSFDHVPDTARQ